MVERSAYARAMHLLFVLLLAASFPGLVMGATGSPKRVLILDSYGRNVASTSTVILVFRTEISSRSTEPIDLHEASLEMARFAQPEHELPLVNFFRERFSTHKPDLVVTVGSKEFQRVIEAIYVPDMEEVREILHDLVAEDTSAGREDGRVHAAVTDSGKGIPAEEFETVFNPFFTTKPQGLGMGLSISRSIITRHQGRIWVESHPDAGATFRFSLPALPDGHFPGGLA
jgi:hypothetical protein